MDVHAPIVLEDSSEFSRNSLIDYKNEKIYEESSLFSMQLGLRR